MQGNRTRPISGHVYRFDGKRGSTWRAKYRLPDGRQVNRTLGPVWTGKGRPPAGYLTRTTAKAALDALLTDARRGTLAGMVQTGATVAEAAAEWLRHAEHERGVKASTMREYRSVVSAHVLPTFGERPLEDVTTRDVERWTAGLLTAGLSRRTASKAQTILHGIFERARRVYGLGTNPVVDAESLPHRYDPGRFEFYSPEEVHALARAAESEQDAAIFVTAGFTGLRRGELVALRWRAVDFENAAVRVTANVNHGEETTTKGRTRTVPMIPEVASALARLSRRERFTRPDDLVFPGLTGEFLDPSALRRRFTRAAKRAGLRPLRFHDLRHSFGSVAINRGSLTQVQHWLGHSSPQTTARYLHHKSRVDEAALLGDAFRVGAPDEAEHETREPAS